jgi:hypothetical protein
MSKEVLNAKDKVPFIIEDNVQGIVCKNISPKAKIKATVRVNGQEEFIPIPTIGIGALIENQDKIDKIEFNSDIIRQVENVAAGAGRKDVYKNAILRFCQDGEFVVGESDEIQIDLSDLGNVTSSQISTVEGTRIGGTVMRYAKVSYVHSKDKIDVDVSAAKYLMVDPAKIPDEIVMYYEGNESKSIDAELLKALNEDLFGLIRIDKAENGDITHVFGHSESLLLSLAGVTKLVIKDETQNENFNLYTNQ